MKTFNKIMLAIVLIVLTGGVGLFVLTAIKPDMVWSWFGYTEEQPAEPEEPDIPDEPDKPIGEEIKDFKFSGNKITGYLGTEVNLKTLPSSYSKVEEQGESFSITMQDMTDEDKAMEIQNKLSQGAFNCLPNGYSEKIYCADMEEWNDKMMELFPDGDISKALPMQIDLLITTYYVGDDYQITAIADNAFKGNTIITDINIPSHITDIGIMAFSGCSSLINVTLNDNIQYLKDWTFQDCSSLKNINLENVIKFETGVFENCTNLTNVTLNNTLTEISGQLFKGSGLTKIDIPSSVESIGQNAFASCLNLTSLVIPEGVKTLGTSFIENSAIKILEVPASVENLDSFSFNSSNLEFVKLHVSDIDLYILSNMLNMSNAQFFVNDEILQACFSKENSHMFIESNIKIYSLKDYTGEKIELEEITDYRFGIANGTVEIQKYLGNETKVVLPDYVRFKEEYILNQTISSKEEFDSFYLENKDIDCYEISYMSAKAEGAGFENIDDLKSYIDGIYAEEPELFPMQISATTLKVYDYETGIAVDSIYGEGFSNNTTIEEVEFGDTYISICENGFLNCTNLKKVTLSENFETFFFNTFVGTSEDLIIINNSNNVIEVPWGNNMNDSDLLGKMYVKDELFEAYISSESWDDFPRIYPMSELNAEAGEIVYTFNNKAKTATLAEAKTVDSIEIPTTLERAGVLYTVDAIGEYAFGNNSNITAIVIPASIKLIGKSAFQLCKNLTNISFEDNSQLTTIENFAFSSSGINEITIPEGVVSIGKSAFASCENLTTINLPATLKTLGDNTLDSNYTGGVFDGSYNISSITVAEGNTNFKVENSCLIDTTTNALIKAFVDVEEITIPSYVKVIMDSAFAGCDMTILSIPEGVFGIGSRAFDNCQNLEEISFPASVSNLEHSLPTVALIMNCPNLKTIKYLSTVILPCFVGETIENIYVDDTMVEQFKQADGWSSLADKIHSISELNQ